MVNKTSSETRISSDGAGMSGRFALSMARAALAAVAAALFCAPAIAEDSSRGLAGDVLRVCSDPNNMPFSNRKREGFENKLAGIVARELGKKRVAYTWHAQRRGFLRRTLNAGKCDLVMGVPNLDMIATTRPYYRSIYVFVSRADADHDFTSMNAPELRDLRIGVHLVGDDGANTPPVHALGSQGIVDNVTGYMIYGDYREDSPSSRVIEDVAASDLDIAAVWGPLAGYHALKAPVELRVEPITDTESYRPLVFQFSIAMGVRKNDEFFKERLDEIIADNRDEIEALLDSYGVPRT